MYPLDMKLADGSGFAVANDEIEHQALTAAGYGPAYVPPKKTAKAPAADTQASTDE